MDMEFTTHCRARMNQRGISDEMVRVVMELGSRTYVRQAKRIFLGKKDTASVMKLVDSMKEELAGLEAQRNELRRRIARQSASV